MSKLAEIAYFCKITSTTSCLVYWREKYYLCWSSYQFELMKDLQMFEYSGVDTKCPYIHQLYRWTGISIFIILMLRIVCEYLSWSGTILCCNLKQSATRNILKEIHVSENSYLFHIQEEESFRQDLQSICRSLNVRF